MDEARGTLLLLGTANGARSLLAEAIARHLASAEVDVVSAGLRPAERHPLLGSTLAERGLDAAGLEPKSLAGVDLARVRWLVFVGEREPVAGLPSDVEPLSWHLAEVPDPAAGDAVERFRAVRDELWDRLESWFAGREQPSPEEDELATLERAMAELGGVTWSESRVEEVLAGEREIDASDDFDETPLHWAVLKGREDLVRRLLAAGADVEARTTLGNAPLHFAAQGGCLELTRLLLEAGADVEATNQSGRTPLMGAGEEGRADQVRLLLERGAGPDRADADGNTLVGEALRHPEVVEVFVAHGVKLNGRRPDGFTELGIACRWKRPDVVRCLLEHGADPDEDAGGGRTAHEIAAGEIDEWDQDDDYEGNRDAVRRLLAARRR